LEKAEHAPDLATLRGLEGAASKAYFAVLRAALRKGRGDAFPETPAATAGLSPEQKPGAAADLARNASPLLVFGQRTRRPPRDPVNALLSLGYTLLGEAIGAALEVVGLDPYQGFYHADKYGRPALALDLLEEFRGPVADSVALTLINKRMLGTDDFVSGTGEPAGASDDPAGRAAGVYLKRDALKVYLREFSERLEATITHPLAGRPMTYRKCLELQARQAAKTITGEAPRYMPLRVR
jgi:CRISPR-associated protein Cas1